MNKNDIKSYRVLENNDELIIDKNYRYHLFRNCEELTKGKEAIFATSYHNDFWKYRDISGFEHMFNANDEEITKGVKTMVVECYNNGYWKYMSKNGSWNIIDNRGNNVTPNESMIYECSVYDNGDVEYSTDEHGKKFYIQKRN